MSQYRVHKNLKELIIIINADPVIRIYDLNGTVVRTFKAVSGEKELGIDDLCLCDGTTLFVSHQAALIMDSEN